MTGKPSVSDKEEDTVELISTCLKKIGEMGAAVNLGPLVNTPFDEESQGFMMIVYYFSLPMDGLDTERQIYSNVEIVDDSIYHVTHLYPVNSSGDDIHFVLHPSDESVAI